MGTSNATPPVRVKGAPHEALKPLVASDYLGVTEVTDHAHGLLLPATASVLLILKISESPQRPPTFVNGVRSSYTILDGACATSYVEVRLTPLGAFRLLGLPMDEISDKLVDLDDVVGTDGRRLGDMVRDAATWADRFSIVDAFFLRRLADAPCPAPEVGWAWQRLVATGGATPIGQLAKDVGWSHQRLITRLRQQMGLSPKTAARLVRFDRVQRHITELPRSRWAQVAADFGYTDQDHLVREFRQFTGSTPTAFQSRAYASGRAPAYG